MKRVLVTGAGGFIGGRVVEKLHTEGKLQPLAGVRSWKGVGRVARLGVETVRCDLADPVLLQRAMTGVDSVVHCAMSDSDSITKGTAAVIEAARQAKVRRVIFLSTVEVYSQTEGDVTEEMVNGLPPNEYGAAKREAEEIIRRNAGPDISLLAFRPGIVYGPFSKYWLHRYVDRLTQGALRNLAPEFNGRCNAIYVDDVVGAIQWGLEAPLEPWQVYNLNGPEVISWNDYFTALANAFGQTIASPEATGSSSVRATALKPVRALAKQLLKNHRARIMALYNSNWLVKSMFRRVETTLRNRPDETEIDIYRRNVSYNARRFTEVAQQSSRITLAQGTGLCAAYAREYGIL